MFRGIPLSRRVTLPKRLNSLYSILNLGLLRHGEAWTMEVDYYWVRRVHINPAAHQASARLLVYSPMASPTASGLPSNTRAGTGDQWR
jgi:hypothetical protein